MVERDLAKVKIRVRFPVPAPPTEKSLKESDFSVGAREAANKFPF